MHGGAGLSSGALKDAISASDDVLGDKDTPGTIFFQYGEPSLRRCQPLVFSRLRIALSRVVAETAGPRGADVLALRWGWRDLGQ